MKLMTALVARQPLRLLPLMLAGCGGEPLHEDEAAGVLRAPIVGGRPL